MCGRFTYRLTWREIYELYRLTMPELPGRNLQARYNVCPTTTIDAVTQRDAKRELIPMRWGLVPSWWKKKDKEGGIEPPTLRFSISAPMFSECCLGLLVLQTLRAFAT
jgi:putative SOS response-associated peptidase YedK